jgi:hypothetical protein
MRCRRMQPVSRGCCPCPGQVLPSLLPPKQAPCPCVYIYGLPTLYTSSATGPPVASWCHAHRLPHTCKSSKSYMALRTALHVCLTSQVLISLPGEAGAPAAPSPAAQKPAGSQQQMPPEVPSLAGEAVYIQKPPHPPPQMPPPPLLLPLQPMQQPTPAVRKDLISCLYQLMLTCSLHDLFSRQAC